jgi:CcmD family protein
MYSAFLRIFFLIAGICFAGIANAQDSLSREAPRMADGMRANGKIYVVVTVLIIILSGLFIYLIRLDRKISRLEKTMK